MKKRDLRIFLMQTLYTMEVTNVSAVEALEFVNEERYDEEVKEWLFEIEKNLNTIDELIEKSLKDYKISRLNIVDRQIIRVATYEILKVDVDIKIIIDEALEITKEFSDEGNHKAVSFNNRLLQNIYDNKEGVKLA